MGVYLLLDVGNRLNEREHIEDFDAEMCWKSEKFGVSWNCCAVYMAILLSRKLIKMATYVNRMEKFGPKFFMLLRWDGF